MPHVPCGKHSGLKLGNICQTFLLYVVVSYNWEKHESGGVNMDVIDGIASDCVFTGNCSKVVVLVELPVLLDFVTPTTSPFDDMMDCAHHKRSLH